MDVKIIKENTKNELKSISIQLPVRVIEKLDEAAKKADVSRQKLAAAILEQALDDKSFVVKVRE
jgi:metal-responsive CopG/Arc/MetJ family transcriptional regulator